jgi:hypothetical protein
MRPVEPLVTANPGIYRSGAAARLTTGAELVTCHVELLARQQPAAGGASPTRLTRPG